MRVNERGGYDVLIQDGRGRYLAGDNIDNPIWVADEDAAAASNTDDEAMETAAMYGLTDGDGKLKDGYGIVRIPWVDSFLELDSRFIDPETGDKRMDEIRRYVFGDGPVEGAAV